MNFRSLNKSVQRFVTENAPAILTGVGIAGAVVTAALSVRAGIRATNIVRDEMETDEDFVHSFKTHAQLTWVEFMPPLATLAVTVGAVFCANRIHTARTAAVVAALALSNDKADEYKDKALEKLGVKKEQEIRDEIAQDRVNADYKLIDGDFQLGQGMMLMHDAYSGRFFASTIEQVRGVVNDVNHAMTVGGEDSQTISDFYDGIGLSHTSISDEFGWNSADPLRLEWSTVKTPNDGPAAHSFEFATKPIMRPWNNVSFH